MIVAYLLGTASGAAAALAGGTAYIRWRHPMIAQLLRNHPRAIVRALLGGRRD